MSTSTTRKSDNDNDAYVRCILSVPVFSLCSSMRARESVEIQLPYFHDWITAQNKKRTRAHCKFNIRNHQAKEMFQTGASQSASQSVNRVSITFKKCIFVITPRLPSSPPPSRHMSQQTRSVEQTVSLTLAARLQCSICIGYDWVWWWVVCRSQ